MVKNVGINILPVSVTDLFLILVQIYLLVKILTSINHSKKRMPRVFLIGGQTPIISNADDVTSSEPDDEISS